jgi:hypothetical protein
MKLCKTALVLAVASALTMQSAYAGKAISKKITKPAIIDIELGANGTLLGAVLEKSGKPVIGEKVQIFQGKKKIAEATTNRQGQYSIKGLRGGTYRIASRSGSEYYRMWRKGTAPKNAYSAALIQRTGKVVRGQLGDFNVPLLDGVSTLNIVTAGATLGLGLVSLNETQDNGDDLSALQQQINDLQNSAN